jgi:hypothetical protein
MGLLHRWLEAVDAEASVRGRFAPPEREIKTLAEARAYLAWHKTVERAAKAAQTDPESMDARAADRLRYDLARRLHNLQKTLEPGKSQVDCHPGPASPARAQAQDKSGHDEGENAEQA